jgi:hypothetical protein
MSQPFQRIAYYLSSIPHFFRYIFLAIFVLFISLFFPGNIEVDYKFELGNSWEYEDLRAPFAFPIQKSKNELEFEKKLHDFGTIKGGEKGTYVFKFKNTGDKPLIISNAQGSCGCTVPTYPKEPIAPGKTGEINVVFDSKGKPGPQTKKVTITANTLPEQTMLEIKANVIGSDVKTK